MQDIVQRYKSSTNPVIRRLAQYAEKLESIRGRQAAELAYLRDLYRWRKQSEEPAPQDVDLEVYIPPFQGQGINGITSTATLQIFRLGEWDVWPQEYWRPLDLPEDQAR